MTEEAFQSPISNVLDLHHFQAKDAPALIDEFLWQCERTGFLSASIIHGKGTGALRELVHLKLSKNAQVKEFHLDGENWGKTIFHLNF